MAGIRPTTDRIVVKRLVEEQKGLIITQKSKHEHPDYQGIVLAVGDGKVLANGTRVPVDVKVGDLILINGVAGSRPLDDPEHGEVIIVTEDDVLLVFEEE